MENKKIDKNVINKYKSVNKGGNKKVVRDACEFLLQETTDLKQGPDFQVGKTKVMLRSDGFLRLETQRNTLVSKFAVKIQSTWRAHRFHKLFAMKRKKAILIQKMVRGLLAKTERRQLEKSRALELEKIRKRAEEQRKKEEVERKRLEEIKRKEEEAERVRLAELKRIADEEAQRKEIERRRLEEEKIKQQQERLRLEAEQRRIEEEAKRREEERIRFEEERKRQEVERLEKLERERIETAAAIKLQSVFRVLLAQNEANRRYEAKQQEKQLVAEAANVVIDVFRENLRKRRVARELEKQKLEEEKEERMIRKQEAMRLKEERRLKKIEAELRRQKSIENIQKSGQMFEMFVYVATPVGFVLLMANPRLLMMVLGIVGSLAAAATIMVNAQKVANSQDELYPVAKKTYPVVATMKRKPNVGASKRFGTAVSNSSSHIKTLRSTTNSKAKANFKEKHESFRPLSDVSEDLYEGDVDELPGDVKNRYNELKGVNKSLKRNSQGMSSSMKKKSFRITAKKSTRNLFAPELDQDIRKNRKTGRKFKLTNPFKKKESEILLE